MLQFLPLEAFLVQEKPLDQRIVQRKATQAKHNSMFGRVYSVKIQHNKLSKSQLDSLNSLFTEAKWFYNYCVQHLSTIISVDTTLKSVPVLFPDKSDLKPQSFNFLSSQMKQAIKDRLISNSKSLKTTQDKLDRKPTKFKKTKSKSKRKKNKTKLKPNAKQNPSKTQLRIISNKRPSKQPHTKGSIKFKSKCNSIPLKQYNMTYKIDFIRSAIKLQGLPFWMHVNGLKQLKNECDICSAVFIRKGKDFYLNVMTYSNSQPKNSSIQQIQTPVGIDFGVTTPVTISDGTKLEWSLPINDSIKRITRKCFKRKNKKTKIKIRGKGNKRIRNRGGRPDSKNKTKDLAKRKKAYEKLNNQRADSRNKIVSYLNQRYAVIVLQDDNIAAWQSGGMGKSVTKTGIGGIKTALKNKAATSILISGWFPSSKTCSNCGFVKKKLKRSEKTYECSECGFACCRDINGATTTRDEGLRLGTKTVIQKNLINFNHVRKEEDMVRESDRIKSLETTKVWAVEKQAEVVKEKEEHGTCGVHETMLSKYVKVSKRTLTYFERKKPGENATAGFLVGKGRKLLETEAKQVVL